ncbi:helix-turn-helix domain-containing protein [Glaciecola sp. 1036]|uniref:helix-turn-helix domain-containing protein n=1 Tax=Alteromonadaceae TaxID=72275 RepID=UPI003D00F6C5
MEFGIKIGLVIVVVVLSLVLLVQRKQLSRYKSSLTGSIEPQARVSRHIDAQQISAQLKAVVTNMIKSRSAHQFDEQGLPLYQTDLRNEIAQLRSISDKLARSAPKKPSQNKTKQADSSISFRQHFFETMQSLSNYAQAHRCKLVVTQIDHAYIDMPQAFLQKIIRELILNAIVHNPSGTQITVSGIVVAGSFVLNVRDNGRGLSEKSLSQIYAQSMFRQPHFRRYTDANCFIDLPSIITALKSLGGDLEIACALDYGTCIRASFPLAASQQAENLPIEHDALNDVENYDIILFNPQKNASHELQRKLNERLRTHSVNNLDIVISLVLQRAPQFIVCDLAAQYGEGIQLKKIFQYQKQLRQIPIIFLVSPISMEERLNILNSGIHYILEQPVSSQEVLSLLTNLIYENKLSEQKVEEALVTYTLENEDVDTTNEQDFQQRFSQCLSVHFDNPSFTMQDCADQLNMHEKTLQRYISKYYQTSFRLYLRKYRLEKSKSMILQGMSVTKASLEVGIYNPSYFSKCFREEFGFSPSILSKRVG